MNFWASLEYAVGVMIGSCSVIGVVGAKYRNHYAQIVMVGISVSVQSCTVSVQSCMVRVEPCMVSVQSCTVSVQSCMVSVQYCMVSVQSCMVSVQSCDQCSLVQLCNYSSSLMI